MRDGSKRSTLDDRPDAYNWLNIVRKCVGGLRRTAVCRLCGKHSVAVEICAGCTRDLPWRTTPWQRRLGGLDTVAVCFEFGYPIRQLIHRTKYGRDIVCARLLGELAASRFAALPRSPGAVVLYPVPLARGRMIRRGFNQALEIALPISKATGLRIDEVSIYKPKALKTQSKLDAAARRSNIRGAFLARRGIESGPAIVVDDVLTTGATLSAMARTLRAAGATEVHAWVLAAV